MLLSEGYNLEKNKLDKYYRMDKRWMPLPKPPEKIECENSEKIRNQP